MARTVGLVFPVVAAPAAPASPTPKPRKKAEIQAYLDNLGIEYPDDATVDELKALMPEEE